MNTFSSREPMYLLFINQQAVELCLKGEEEAVSGRLLCFQKNYQNLVEFGMNMAMNRQLRFVRHC